MKTRVYIQSEFLSDIKMVEVEANATVDEVRKACLTVMPEEARSAELHLFEEDADESSQATTVGDLKKDHGIRIHLHRCKHVGVTVRYNGQQRMHRFGPGTTIGRVKKWAAREFGLTDADAAEHVLQIAGTTTQPDADIHLGSLASHTQCSVVFDLVPAHRING